MTAGEYIEKMSCHIGSQLAAARTLLTEGKNQEAEQLISETLDSMRDAWLTALDIQRESDIVTATAARERIRQALASRLALLRTESENKN
jgi:hypothetical protein